eukprot:6212302-Pleurochrysis_carterae.AAC.1
MALVAQTGSSAVTDHDLDAPTVCRVWSHMHDLKVRQLCMIPDVRSKNAHLGLSKVNELSGQIKDQWLQWKGASGNASGTLTAE